MQSFVIFMLLFLPAGDDLFRGEDHMLARLEFKEARIVDAIQLISEISGLNTVATEEAGVKEVTLLMQEVSASQAVEVLCKVAGLWYRRDTDTQTFRVMTTDEYQKDHIVYRKDQIKVFTLRYPNAVSVATSIEDLFGDRVYMSLGIDEAQLDAMSGLGGRGIGGFQDAGMSSYGYTENGMGSAGRYGRSGMNGGGRYSRGVGYGGGMGFGSGGMGRERPMESGSVVDDQLTSEQISMLEDRLGGERYAEAGELAGISRKDPPIFVTVNRPHNIIVVRTADTDAMQDLDKLIGDLDRPTPQVLLEMKILLLRVGDSFASVFDLELFSGNSTSGTPSDQVANPLDPDAATSPVNVFGAGNFELEDATLVYQFMNEQVRARIQLLEQNGRLELVSTPVLLASNNRPARLFVGQERVLTTGARTNVVTPAAGAPTTAIEPITEVRDIGNTLIIVPKINADRTVTLYVSHDNSTVDPESATIPISDGFGGVTAYPIDSVDTANMQATVVAKDGMTLALGGLITTSEFNAHEKVPILGDIPLLGVLFQKTEIRREKEELILLITPKVLFTPEEAEMASTESMKELSRHRYFKEDDQFDKEMEQVFDGVDQKVEDVPFKPFFDRKVQKEEEEDW